MRADQLVTHSRTSLEKWFQSLAVFYAGTVGVAAVSLSCFVENPITVLLHSYGLLSISNPLPQWLTCSKRALLRQERRYR